jgi:hypothetical protein
MADGVLTLARPLRGAQSGESARVVVSDHDDEAGAEDRHEGDETMFPGFARGDIAVQDGAQRAIKRDIVSRWLTQKQKSPLAWLSIKCCNNNTSDEQS